MREADAQGLVTMLAAATSSRLFPDERTVWEQQFMPLNADLATKAILSGRRQWTRFPSWAQFYEAYKAERLLTERDNEGWREKPSEPMPIPEWVHIWYWAVFVCGEHPPFAQYDPRPKDAMSAEEYAALRARWVEAGTPKLGSAAELMKRMTGTPPVSQDQFIAALASEPTPDPPAPAIDLFFQTMESGT